MKWAARSCVQGAVGFAPCFGVKMPPTYARPIAAALLVPIPREPLVPLVCFWSACMHPFVTALLGMSSLSQVDPLSLVVSQFASRRFYALTVRCPLHTLSLIRAFWGRFEKLA